MSEIESRKILDETEEAIEWARSVEGSLAGFVLDALDHLRHVAETRNDGERERLLAVWTQDLVRKGSSLKAYCETVHGSMINLQATLVEALAVRDTEVENLRVDLRQAQFAFHQLSQRVTDRVKEHKKEDAEVRKTVWEMANGKCFYCSVELDLASFHVDHIVAKNNGGPDHISNYVPACARCNISKSDKPFTEFFLKARPSSQPQLVLVDNKVAAAE